MTYTDFGRAIAAQRSKRLNREKRLRGQCKFQQIDVQKFHELYHAGTHIPEIAKSLGVSYHMLIDWMRDHGYDSMCPEKHAIAMELWRNGATDAEIAEAIDRSYSRIAVWRESHKLRKNPKGGWFGRPRKSFNK